MPTGKVRRRATAMRSRHPIPVSPVAAPMRLVLGATQPETPAWAQSLARRQRTTQAGLVAAQALREGDRPASGSGPDLKDKS